MVNLHHSRKITADHALLEDGWHDRVSVMIDVHGDIVEVSSGRAACMSGADWHCRYLLPAMCNVHSHAFQRALAGRTETPRPSGDDNFWGWREHMYQLANTLQPEDIESISRLAFMEMLEAGFCAVGEFHYLHHQPNGHSYQHPAELAERVMAAAADSGIGLCMLPVLYAQADADGSAPLAQQQRFSNSLDRYLTLWQQAEQCLREQLPGDSSIGIAPHSLRAVSKSQLLALLQHIGQRNMPIHMHVAEQTAELASVRQHLGLAPVQWLLEHAEVDQRWCMIHATHAESAELRALASAACSVGLCPQTEASLGDGLFAVQDWLQLGGHTAIGSDSNINISIAEELRLLEYTQRLLAQRRQVLLPLASAATATDPARSQGEQLYRMAVAGGARALQRRSGVIASGYHADLLHLDSRHDALDNLDQNTLLDGWIFASGRAMPRDVWSAGRHCVVNGQHVQRQQIQAQYRNTMKAITWR
ncbi:MAG: formimidoylglutamate deiminase [Gammaproteobacteria bacterium]|jgi:formimidoylglutamate deiminase|nr:formimidoylglutamate deiminase [Gammaproteobacteria bacterium]